jgi:hypothetical protein
MVGKRAVKLGFIIDFIVARLLTLQIWDDSSEAHFKVALPVSFSGLIIKENQQNPFSFLLS